MIKELRNEEMSDARNWPSYKCLVNYVLLNGKIKRRKEDYLQVENLLITTGVGAVNQVPFSSSSNTYFRDTTTLDIPNQGPSNSTNNDHVPSKNVRYHPRSTGTVRKRR